MTYSYYYKNDFLNFLNDENKNLDSINLSSPFSLIVLNSSSLTFSVIKKLWNHAIFTVCADGGANHLYNSCIEFNEDKLKFIPDYIVGDLDSIRTEVKDFYSLKGSNIIQLEDQDTNDLEKSLQFIYNKVNNEYQESKNENNETRLIHRTIIVGGFDGSRIDHELSLYHAMLSYSRFDEEQEDFTTNIDYRVILVTNYNTTFFLKKGKNIIFPLNQEGKTCGLFPIGGEVSQVETKGLNWDLPPDSSLELGKFVSTSNFILNYEEVVINVSSPLLWTCSYKFNS